MGSALRHRLEGIGMLTLSNQQIDAIRQSELRFKLSDSLKPRSLLSKPLIAINEDDFDALYDACMDVFHHDAPGVQEFTAEQTLGPYSIWIRGVAGAYFVQSPDDEYGVFSTLEEASAQVKYIYGEFLRD
jgi:hypothetical protein